MTLDPRLGLDRVVRGLSGWHEKEFSSCYHEYEGMGAMVSMEERLSESVPDYAFDDITRRGEEK